MKKTILYNGQVELLFDKYKHCYYRDGEKIPSVTTILKIINKPALVNWAVRTVVDYLEEEIVPGNMYSEIELMDKFKQARRAHYDNMTSAGNIGTFVHNWIEKYINGQNPVMPIDEKILKIINNFLSWQKEHDVKFLISEQKVYSKKYNYTGTLDFICRLDGELYIGDIKTSSGIWTEYLLQTAAYQLAREEEYPSEKYAGQVIVRVGRDGVLETRVINKEENILLVETFLNALNLYLNYSKITP